MTARRRHRGSDTLKEFLKGFANRPMFLAYNDDFQKAPVRSDLIIAQKAFVQASVREFDCLSWVQSDVEAALQSIYDESASLPNWKIPADQIKLWRKSMALKIRTMLKHVNAAMTSSTAPRWLSLLELPIHKGKNPKAEESKAKGVEDEEEEDEDEDEETEQEDEEEEEEEEEEEKKKAGDESPAATKYNFGFSKDTGKAWRAPVGKPKAKEIADTIDIPKGFKATDPPLAKWSDGKTWSVQNLTCEEWQATLKGASPDGVFSHPSSKKGRINQPDLWSGTCKEGNLRVALRKDRSLLVSLYLKKNVGKDQQICQMKLATLRSTVKLANVQEQAVEVMKKVGEAVAAGTIEVDGVFELRNKYMTEAGLFIESKPVAESKAVARKRPAAAKEVVAKRRPAAAEDGEAKKRPAEAANPRPVEEAQDSEEEDDEESEEANQKKSESSHKGLKMDFGDAAEYDDFLS